MGKDKIVYAPWTTFVNVNTGRTITDLEVAKLWRRKGYKVNIKY